MVIKKSLKINDDFIVHKSEIKKIKSLDLNGLYLYEVELKNNILCYDNIKKTVFICTGVEYTYDGIYLLEILNPEYNRITATRSLRRIF